MSLVQLIQFSAKEADKKIQHIPIWYYFLPAIFGAIMITLPLYLVNPYLDTWTTESLFASIVMMSLSLSGVFVLVTFVVVASGMFFSILLSEKKRQDEENRVIPINELRSIFAEELQKQSTIIQEQPNYDVKNALSQANSSYQSHDQRIIDLERKVSQLGLSLFFARWEIKKLKRLNQGSETIIADKFQANNKIEDPKP